MDVKPWYSSNLFAPGTYTLPELIREAKAHDFAILVFSPDDKVTSRSKVFQASRDNVLVEFGLFMDSLGLDRTFAVIADNVKVPTDLMGLTTIRYEQKKYLVDANAALQLVVAKIQSEVHTKGLRPERKIVTEAVTWKSWTSPTGTWEPKRGILELSEASSISDAAYTWSPQPLRIGGVIEFKMSIENRTSSGPIFDFRMSLFSASPTATRSGPDHYLLVAPWSGNIPVFGGEDIRVDYIAAKQAHSKLHIPVETKFILGKQYQYRLTLLQDQIILEIDSIYRIIYSIDVAQELRRGMYWGFSSHTAHLHISGLRTNLG